MSAENNIIPSNELKLRRFSFAVFCKTARAMLLIGLISAIAVLLFPSSPTWHDKFSQGLLYFAIGILVHACAKFYYTNHQANSDVSQSEAACVDGEKKYVQDQTNVENQDEVVSLDYIDELTQLGNRQRMEEKFKTLQKDAQKNDIKYLIGLANIEGMKSISDLYGLEAIDEVLKQCAQRFSATVEDDGFVFRFTGEKFGFLFPNITDQEGADDYGKILLDVLQAPFTLDGMTCHVSGTFGFALYPDAGGEFDAILESVKSALYFANLNEESKITVFTNEIKKLVCENARMEHLLRNAVVKNQIEPFFQPIISIQNGTLLGFEALARWRDDELGFVSPAKFIPLAEERGIISALTEKMLLNAATIASKWPNDLFLSFNLSSIQMSDPTTAENVLGTIRQAGMSPKRLEIEVTETAIMNSPHVAESVIEELHDAGVRVSMDDFGTGQSSLGRLRELKLDKLKIDRAFITELGIEKSADHIVRAVLEMCAGLELAVVAEGIEEMHQAEILKSYGCHAGQGYLFGKPQNARATENYIREFLYNMRGEETELKYSA